MSETIDTRAKHMKLIEEEIDKLRGWLDYLRRDITREKGVISAVILTSINESCMSLLYNAGVANGAVMAQYDEKSSAPPAPEAQKERK